MKNIILQEGDEFRGTPNFGEVRVCRNGCNLGRITEPNFKLARTLEGFLAFAKDLAGKFGWTTVPQSSEDPWIVRLQKS